MLASELCKQNYCWKPQERTYTSCSLNTPGGSYRAFQERPVYSVIFRDLDEPSADPIWVASIWVASIPEVIVGTSEKGPAYKGRVEIEDTVEVLNVYSGVNR